MMLQALWHFINIHSNSMLWYQHQWELEQKKTDSLEVPKADKKNWIKTMELIVLHLKLIKGMRDVTLAYVVR